MNKKCSKCQRELPLERFRTHKRDGIIASCKDCERRYFRSWRKTTEKGKDMRQREKVKYAKNWNDSEGGKTARERVKHKKRLAKALTLITLDALKEQGE